MISYHAIKKQFTVGTQLEVEHHTRPVVSGPRVVIRSQTNAIEMRLTRHPEKGVVWLYWPKADRAQVLDEQTLLILDQDSKPVATYRIVS